MDGTKVTAATWGGMLKAIHQWHQRMNQEQTRQQWTDIVNNNGGEIRSWEPALGQFKHQDVTAAELTDETMLLHEALEMNHCVHMYGSRAQQGTIRIFSLTRRIRQPGHGFNHLEKRVVATGADQRKGATIRRQMQCANAPWPSPRPATKDDREPGHYHTARTRQQFPQPGRTVLDSPEKNRLIHAPTPTPHPPICNETTLTQTPTQERHK